MTKLVSFFRSDLSAGIVVFLVALPLCLGIALASDAPLLSGVVSGIVAGLVVSLLSGSELSVSGPAAGLTLIVAGAIQACGSFESFLLAVLLAGVLQIVMGSFRLGVVSAFVPTCVIKGMLSAIGIIIILKQIPHALGRDVDFEGDFAFKHIVGTENTFTDIINAFYSFSLGAVIICGVSLAIIIYWGRAAWIKRTGLKNVPGALVAVVASILLNQLFRVSFPELYLSGENSHLVTLPINGGLGGFLSNLHRPDFSAFQKPAVYLSAVTIALVGSLESLLSIEATDKIDPYRRISDRNRELVAQGVGNITAGLIGGIPITAVILRSSANVYAGAKSRASSFFHGVLLLLTVIIIPGILNLIPLACLAAILFVIGYKLTRISLFRQLYRDGADQFLPFIVTIVAIMFTDILQGVFFGMVVGVIMIVKANFYSAVSFINEGSDYLIRFTKDVSFVNKNRLSRVFARVPSDSRVLIDGSRAMFIDHDIYELIEDFKESAKYSNISVELKNCERKQYPSFFRK